MVLRKSFFIKANRENDLSPLQLVGRIDKNIRIATSTFGKTDRSLSVYNNWYIFLIDFLIDTSSLAFGSTYNLK